MASVKKKDRDRITLYIKDIQPILRVERWKVTVEKEYCEEDRHAEIQTTPERFEAWLRVGAGWDALPTEEKRWAITHEIAHLLLRPLLHCTGELSTQAEVHLGETAWAIFWRQWSIQEEQTTDEIARVLLPFLPAWPD